MKLKALPFPRKIKYVFLILAVCCAAYPKILTFAEETTEPFLYSSVAVAEASYEQNQILINPFQLRQTLPDAGSNLWQPQANFISVRVAVTSLLVIVSRVTGITIRHLMFVPITGLMMILLGFALARTLTKSSVLAALFALFVAYHENEANSIFYITHGYVMMFLFLMIFYRTIESGRARRRNVTLLVLIFVNSYLTYYHADFLNLTVVAGCSLIMFLAKRGILMRSDEKLPSFLSLSLAFAAIFAMFDSAFYFFMTGAHPEKGVASLLGFYKYVKGLLWGETTTAYVMRQGSIIPAYIEMLIRVIILSAVGLHIMSHVIRSLRAYRFVKITHNSIMYFSIITASILQAIIYISMGFFGGFIYGILTVGLLALYSLRSLGRRLGKEKVFFLISLLLVFASVLRFAVIWEDQTTSYYYRHYTAMSQTAPWLVRHIDQGSTLSDHSISGRILAEAAFHSKASEILSYPIGDNLDILYDYNQSRFDRVMRGGYNYFVSSRLWKDKFVVAAGWGPVGNPLGERLFFLNNYTSLNEIYDDGMGSVYGWNSGY